MDKYIDFIINGKKDIKVYYSITMNFLECIVLENITNNDSCKKLYFEIIDCFLKNYIIIQNNGTKIFKKISYVQYFISECFYNTFYLKNILDLD